MMSAKQGAPSLGVVRGHHAERHEQEHTRCPRDAGTRSLQNRSEEFIHTCSGLDPFCDLWYTLTTHSSSRVLG